MNGLELEINELRKEKNAIILAHFYQDEAIQKIADFVGDSLALSQEAAKTDASIIVFAGVHFMAETAKILNPYKKVLLPDNSAGCSLADSCSPDTFHSFLDMHPDYKVVTYINCSAEIKAMSDVVCTSSNAEKIIASFPQDTPIIFAPDRNLGRYIMEKTGRKLVLWEGACMVHEAFSVGKLIDLYNQYPDAEIIAHPESEEQILDIAAYIGSTSQLIDYVSRNPGKKYIVATEAGILYKMQLANPDTVLIPAPAKEDNTCACSECAFMKVNTLEKLRDCLRDETPEILLDEDLRLKALIPIQKMLNLS